MPEFKKIKAASLFDDQIAKLTLNAPKGNILDIEMISELTQAIREFGSRSEIKAFVFEGAGENFSYGASIPEHTKEIVVQLLSVFRKFFETLIDVSKPCLALVQGQCLGGGLELAAFCHWIFASKDAKFGQPEIELAVFPPFASLILPYRIGQTAADDLILSGRSVGAEEAKRIGLVFSATSDPDSDLQKFITGHILPKSTAALQFAVKSSRFEMHKAFLENISEIEKLYVEELMLTEDANEGIKAFMEKRNPVWKNR